MSPCAPKPYLPEIDNPPVPWEEWGAQHQIDVFRAGGRRDELWEFLEKLEEEAKTSAVINERR